MILIPQVPSNRPLSEYSVLQPVVNQDTEYMVMDNPDIDNPDVDNPDVEVRKCYSYVYLLLYYSITSIKILIAISYRDMRTHRKTKI